MRGRVLSGTLLAGVALTAVGAGSSATSGLVAERTSAGLAMSQLDGSGRRLLSPLPLESLAFSPDGRSVAGVLGGRAYVVDVETGATRVVANRPGALNSPRWTRDGKKLAFAWATRDDCRGRRGSSSVVIADLATGTSSTLGLWHHRPARRLAVFYEPLAWSPDGRRVLYREQNWRWGSNCGLLLGDNFRSEYVLHAGVGGGRPTIVRETFFGQADWSADGSLIAVEGDGCAIVVTRRDGRVVRRWPRQIAHAQACADATAPWLAWSRSEREVYAADAIRLVGLRPAEGTRRVMFSGLGRCPRDTCTNHIITVGASHVVLHAHAEGTDPQLVGVATSGGERFRRPAPATDDFAVWVP